MTFRQSLNVLGDRALARMVGSVDAGACVIEHGQVCGCFPKLDTPCRAQLLNTVYEFSCFGSCNVAILNQCC